MGTAKLGAKENWQRGNKKCVSLFSDKMLPQLLVFYVCLNEKIGVGAIGITNQRDLTDGFLVRFFVIHLVLATCANVPYL